MMGVAGSFAASFFWAVAPLPVALNRLTKEETPLTFFTLLACYFYCRAAQADADKSAWRWYDLSAIGFGLGLGLAVHSSSSWLECTRLVSCRKNGAESQAVSIQL